MSARVAVVGGGQSPEHEVSLASAAAVADAIDASPRFTAVRLVIDRDGTWRDAQGDAMTLGAAADLIASCDAVFPALHGRMGEDGTLAALCELIGVPYVGSGVAAGAIGMDKWVTKLVARAVGLATAPGVLLTRASSRALPWTGPVVVKPVGAGSSVGVSLVSDPALLGEAIDAALLHDERVLVEQCIVGREVDVAVIEDAAGGLFVSAPLEIAVAGGVFDHTSKYDGSATFVVPAALSPAELVAIEAAATKVFTALGCAGLARVDFFLTDAGPVLNEVNTMPGMTAASQLPRMLAVAGLDYRQVVELLLTQAMRSPRRRESLCRDSIERPPVTEGSNVRR